MNADQTLIAASLLALLIAIASVSVVAVADWQEKHKATQRR